MSWVLAAAKATSEATAWRSASVWMRKAKPASRSRTRATRTWRVIVELPVSMARAPVTQTSGGWEKPADKPERLILRQLPRRVSPSAEKMTGKLRLRRSARVR